MQRLRWYFLFVVCIFSGVYISAQFTQKRTQRGPSMSSLKESCCTLYGDVLRSSAQLLCSMGSVQKKAVSALDGYINGDKHAWTETASRQKLTDCQQKLRQLNNKMNELIKECAATLDAIGAL